MASSVDFDENTGDGMYTTARPERSRSRKRKGTGRHTDPKSHPDDGQEVTRNHRAGDKRIRSKHRQETTTSGSHSTVRHNSIQCRRDGEGERQRRQSVISGHAAASVARQSTAASPGPAPPTFWSGRKDAQRASFDRNSFNRHSAPLRPNHAPHVPRGHDRAASSNGTIKRITSTQAQQPSRRAALQHLPENRGQVAPTVAGQECGPLKVDKALPRQPLMKGNFSLLGVLQNSKTPSVDVPDQSELFVLSADGDAPADAAQQEKSPSNGSHSIGEGSSWAEFM